MSVRGPAGSDPSFGGPWTAEKLSILSSYLDAYTTALKNKSFKLMYIDAFAGSGVVGASDDDEGTLGFLEGSASLAIKVADRPFDRLIFVEKNADRCQKLQRLRRENPGRDIRIEHAEANTYLRHLDENWSQWRGVLFLDPFGTQVEWVTIERIASLHALDTWILFPVSAIARMLPTSRRPEDVKPALADRLSVVFGDHRWHRLYDVQQQGSLFGDVLYEREPGVRRIRELYMEKLQSLFGNRLLSTRRSLRNLKNTVLYDFVFCAGHPNGRAVAHRIARHLLEGL